MPVQVTSVISYIANLDKVGTRYKEIILIFKHYQMPMNSQMVLREMRKIHPKIEISSITGRINELSKKENRNFPILMKLHDKRLCPITNNLTIFYKLNQGIQQVLV